MLDPSDPTFQTLARNMCQEFCACRGEPACYVLDEKGHNNQWEPCDECHVAAAVAINHSGRVLRAMLDKGPMLVRIEGVNLVAGMMTDVDGTVIRAAPILGFMEGWTRGRVRAFCVAKNWKAAVVTDPGRCPMDVEGAVEGTAA